MIICLFKPSRFALWVNKGACSAFVLLVLYLNLPGLIRLCALLYLCWLFQTWVRPNLLLRFPRSVVAVHINPHLEAEWILVEFACGVKAHVRLVSVERAWVSTLECIVVSLVCPAGELVQVKDSLLIRLWPDSLAAGAASQFRAWLGLVAMPSLNKCTD